MATRPSSGSGSYYSYSSKRNLRQEEVAAYRRIVIAVVLIVGLLVGGYFLGIPLLARLGAGTTDKVESISPSNTADNIPPTAPRINSLPDAVKTKNLTITGTAESGTTISILINEEEAGTTIADKDGAFSLDVILKGGQNSIVAVAKDASNNTGKETKAAIVVYDAKAPTLTITSPADNANVSTPTIQLVGKTELDAAVSVNDRQLVVQSDGTFSSSVPLAAGVNTLTIVATDKAGNTAKQVRTVTSGAQASASATTP